MTDVPYNESDLYSLYSGSFRLSRNKNLPATRVCRSGYYGYCMDYSENPRSHSANTKYEYEVRVLF